MGVLEVCHRINYGRGAVSCLHRFAALKSATIETKPVLKEVSFFYLGREGQVLKIVGSGIWATENLLRKKKVAGI